MCMVCDGLTRRDFVAAASATVFAGGAAAASDFTGPTEPRGISAVELGDVELGPEFPEIAGVDGRQLRARLWTIEPDGVVPVHSHAGRPALMYVLEGDIIEHRNDRAEPVFHSAGDLSKESGAVVHWWENTGDVPVRLLAVDVFNADPSKNDGSATPNTNQTC